MVSYCSLYMHATFTPEIDFKIYFMLEMDTESKILLFHMYKFNINHHTGSY